MTQWKKAEWKKCGDNYRLERLSKCEKYIIHKWANERSYFISKHEIYDYWKGYKFLVLNFETLKEAKEYINQIGE